MAFLLLAAVTVVVTYSYLTPHFRSCDDLVARVGQVATVPSCQPLGVTDAPVLLVLVIVLGLVVPDMKRISIGGVIELERNVKEQELRTDALERQIALMASASANAATNLYFGDTWPPNARVEKPSDEEFEEKARGLFALEDDPESDSREQS